MKKVIILLCVFALSCSYAPPKDEVDKKSAEIGLYEEWLMGLIALKNTKIPLLNPTGTLNAVEKKFKLMITQLHYNAVDLPFWRQPYYPPEIIVYNTGQQNGFTLPGGFICVTTGLINHVFANSKNGEGALAAILAHELVHLYLEHPKRHYVTMVLKENIGRQYREMAEGIQAASGDFSSDYSKLIIATILKAKQAGTEGYQADMESDADTKAVQILYKAGYSPEYLLDALRLMKHHMGGVHGSYEDRTARVREAISKLK